MLQAWSDYDAPASQMQQRLASAPLSADLSSPRRARYNISSLLLLTDDEDVKEEAREWALQQVVRAPAASSLARP